MLENLSTTSPVQVNNEEVKEPRLLHHGDTLTIGSGLYRFYSDEGAHVEDLPETNNTNNKELKPEPEAPALTEEKRDSIFKDVAGNETDQALAEINFDLIDTGRWLLKVVSGPNNGAEFSMQPESTYLLGTDPATCDIVFHDVSVSRQHAKLTIGKDDALVIEDLKSRNGIALEGKEIQGKSRLNPNTLVSLGTTTFIVFDRESERNTVISPLLPAIVKVLTNDDGKRAEEAKRQAEMQALRDDADKSSQDAMAARKLAAERSAKALGPMILIAVISGLFLLGAFGISTLFKGENVDRPKVNTDQVLSNVMEKFPTVKYSYVKGTGQLLLVGHVLTSVDRDQLMYDLQALPFISDFKDNIIIDEKIWQSTNQILGTNPNWRGVSIYSPEAGKFVITGYLQTRKQAQLLNDWISQNFPYVDLLQKNIIVDEDVASQISTMTQDNGFRDIIVKFSNGELTLSGNIPSGQRAKLNALVDKIKSISGVRTVKNFVVELTPKQAVLNISDNYKVTGSSSMQNGGISVVINGRILSKGDTLDGMFISNIDRQSIYLEKDGVKYQIDYNR
jgi:type III secretion system YscD/HrpQ family protein